MKKQQEKELSKRPFILNVTTPFALILAFIYGKSNSKNDLIKAENDQVYSPHIAHVINKTLAYHNLVYLKVLKLMKEMFVEVRRLYQELQNIDGGVNEAKSLHNNMTQRQIDHQEKEKLRNKDKRNDILLRLSELKQELEQVDLSLANHIERSVNLVNSYIDSYCKGALISMDHRGLQRLTFDRKIKAKIQYDEKFSEIMSICSLNVEKGGIKNEL